VSTERVYVQGQELEWGVEEGGVGGRVGGGGRVSGIEEREAGRAGLGRAKNLPEERAWEL
jgi:hypothetical protein